MNAYARILLLVALAVIAAALLTGCGADSSRDNSNDSQDEPSMRELKDSYDEYRQASFDEGEPWCERWDESDSEYPEKETTECEIQLRDGTVCTVVIINERALGKPACPQTETIDPVGRAQ